MANETEPRALGAALAAPAFVTRGHAVAMHAANRHVERWAPETDARRVRSIRSLGFVDRLVAPWLETAQRSGSLRLFNQYASTGLGERAGGSVSWVFPRPWYQDELDWMAAARRAGSAGSTGAGDAARAVASSVLTTRGTYVAPGAALTAPASVAAAPRVALPAALYEYVAPSLSLAASRPAPIAGVGFGGDALPRGEAYSPLISLAAVQAAELMTRTVAPLVGPRTAAAPAVTPALRSVLSSILARAAVSRGEPPASRLSALAPALVTPPAPRPEIAAPATIDTSAAQVAEQYAAQRARVVELQRIAQLTAHRELAARAEAARPSGAAPSEAAAVAPRAEAARPSGAAPSEAARTAQIAATAELRAAAERAEVELRQRAEAELRQRAGTGQPGATPSAAEIERARATASAAEVERARAALIENAAAGRGAEVQRQADAAAAAERARIEERIAQRLAERSSTQRLHEQARAEAAAHARGPVPPAAVAPSAGDPAAAARRAPAEVIAAIAGLPPELSALLGSVVAQRPERALQAISELNESLRSVELLARSSASGAAFEVTRGPRLVMPAGLGGLVSAVDRAQSIAERPAMLAGQRPASALGAPLAGFAALDAQAAARAAAPQRELRVPHLPWLAAEPRSYAIAASSALGATAAAAPAALTHVAWADRWLARFAGAAPQSLDTITAAGAAAPAARMRALASAAPGVVFVAPDFLRGDLAADPAGRALAAASSAAAAAAVAPATTAAAAPAPGPQRLAPPPEALRFDDDGETPDDVFTAIAAAASRGRTAPARPSAFVPPAAAARAVAATVPGAAAADRPMLADLVAHAAPSAPGAGLSAQLASSPFAAALRHVLTLPSAPSFDVRSLFGADLGAVYLAGLIGPATRELSIGAQSAPGWAGWREAPMVADRPDLVGLDRIDRIVPAFDAAYVAPETARGAAEAGPAVGAIGAVGALGAVGAAAPTAPASAALADTAGALTTLRSALLSWELAAAAEPGAPGAVRLMPAELVGASAISSPGTAAFAALQAAPQSAVYRDAGAARRMIDAMSLPMLGEATGDTPSAWSAPGMVAERAQTWSVAQERSAADLALDFVTPELVLAARVYGLGPTEAAQAARLAIAGPGQLGAMASTIDRTFVEALAIGRDARFETARQRTAPGTTGAARDARGAAPALTQLAAERATAAAAGDAAAGTAPTADLRAAITTAFPTADGGVAAAIAPARDSAGDSALGSFLGAPAPSSAAFGVDRRAPRGAFLWPSATVAALGMNAAAPDGQLSMSVAALELLAAQVVAELGTYTALSDARAAALGFTGEAAGALGTGPTVDRLPGSVGAAALAGAAADAPAGLAARAARAAAVTGTAGAAGTAGPTGTEPREADVLGAAAAMVPASRRARFDALYIALGQSPAGMQWSPAARAARALALAGRGEDSPVSARARAATAWDVLPVVYGSDVAGAGAASGAAASGDGAASASAAAAIAQAMTSHVAPSWLSGPRAAVARAAAPRGSRVASSRAAGLASGDRDVVGAGFGDADIQVAGPGLSALSARAGEALGSYVAPAAPPVAPRERAVDMTTVGAVLRPPTAEPEYVQTGARTGGRYGGGEVEIPPWFEAAARKMLAERTDSADGISLAELTLVTAAPAAHIAASTRSAPSASPPAPGAGGGAQQQSSTAPQIDIEKLATEVYRNILVLMDIARARNGNPYL